MKRNLPFVELKRLQSLVKLHIASFNFALTQGLRLIVHSIFSTTMPKKEDNHFLKLNSLGFHVCKPFSISKKKRLREIPRKSRETKISYQGDLFISILIKISRYFPERFILKIGKIPIMIKSVKCNLNFLKPRQLIELDEEEYETGGYFIIKGNEKILRLLVVPKRNSIFAYSRLSNSQKGPLCSVFSTSFRSVDRVHLSKTLHLHYLCNGTIHCRIIIKKQELFIPVVLLMKVLVEISDKSIFYFLTDFNPKDDYLRKRAVLMIKEFYLIFGNKSRTELKKFLGKIFNLISPGEKDKKPEWFDFILSRNIFVHLGMNNVKKFNLLIAMINRLISVQRGLTSEDNPDSFDSQEFLLPGNLLLIYLREKIENSFYNSKISENTKINISDKTILEKENLKDFIKKFQRELVLISNGFDYIINTGTYSSGYKNEIPQTTGLSVTLERVNYGRFFSFFRSVHRGKFFSEMKNTAGRKLLPQSWGFLCPVHTPDGPSCGILNHISLSTLIVLCNPIDIRSFEKLFLRYGKIKNTSEGFGELNMINFDGEILGYSSDYYLRWFIDKLRSEKISKTGALPKNCEIFYVSRNCKFSPFKQFNFSSQDSRASRPVKWCDINLNSFSENSRIRNILTFKNQKNEIELIGALEQNILNIFNFQYQTGLFSKNNKISHSEIESMGILSLIAGSIPFSSLNQSPRNIYQCQMAKQSIGVPFYTFWRRNDSKSYFLLTPQIPIVRNKVVQDGLKLDSFPNGFNACITFLSYTGFDMEDAIIINRSSIDRGISFSNISSSNFIETNSLQINKQYLEQENTNIEEDGLLGTDSLVSRGDPILFQKFKGKVGLKKEQFFCYNSSEKAIIDQIKVSSEFQKNVKKIKTSIKIRSRRRPNMGDKFASRHGQKGVFSLDFSAIDLPFSEIGVIPDILFNPNGLPSRMTMGLVIESLAGKSGTITGSFNDSSPFRCSEEIDSFGKFSEKIRQVGFQYFGTENLYSGYSGEPLETEIFTGVVHYQRLRHMVLDKFQISNKSPINNLTRQPIKGRKAGGAVRFGEMERDALLGHGCTFLLHDRLQFSSDLHSTMNEEKIPQFSNTDQYYSSKLPNRKIQNKFRKIPRKLLLPYIFKYLISELAAINIKIKINLDA
jgi:DNA-directed RNA polymerase I subunit RPA2